MNDIETAVSSRAPLGIGIAFALLLLIVSVLFESEPDLSKHSLPLSVAVLVFTVPLGFLLAGLLQQAIINLKQISHLWYAVFGLSLIFTTFLFIDGYRKYSKNEDFLREGLIATGVVVEIHPEYHNTIIVSYRVRERTFKVQSLAPKSAEEYMIGDSVTVYYEASDPQHGVLMKPEWHPISALFWWVVIAVVVPITIASQAGKIAWYAEKVRLSQNA